MDTEFLSKIKLPAPGTRLRQALDDIVMARFGTKRANHIVESIRMMKDNYPG